jgi:adenine-specific DNA-methyltransferase
MKAGEMAKTPKSPKQVEILRHGGAKRKNIPTAEHRSALEKDDQSPIPVRYERRNRDLDPQLMWRGKDELDWSDLVVPAPPLFIQEKIHPKVLIDDLMRESARGAGQAKDSQFDLFGDFNGVPEEAKTEYYQHDANWSNRMILGDSLQVMASLAEREGLRGKVQCIYFDPPYGIKFNSNFQWSTTSRFVQDGSVEHITREPEQVKAFRDTWRDGLHSYLTYLRDRLTVARELLTETGSIFVQIGEENVHRVRAVLEEVFGEKAYTSQIIFRKTTGKGSELLDNTYDVILWFSKSEEGPKYRALFERRLIEDDDNLRFVELPDGSRRNMTAAEAAGLVPLPEGGRAYRPNPLTNQRAAQGSDLRVYRFEGKDYFPGWGKFRSDAVGMNRLSAAGRLLGVGKTLTFIRFLEDFGFKPHNDIWDDTRSSGFGEARTYVVQTNSRVVERCLLMATDPGDLVLDPTCGSGTTAYVAEQRGRRWITIDTSRVALALARARLMGARYPYYLLADSKDGQQKEAEIRKTAPVEASTHGDIRLGFVYERVPHIKLKSIANNAEIDVIWEQYQQTLTPLRADLNSAVGKNWEEWEVPREAEKSWPEVAKDFHARWRQARIARQRAIDASIARNADPEYLYDKPYEDKWKVRVAGPFTVESLSPHRVLGVDEDDELIDVLGEPPAPYGEEHAFVPMILENLRVSGVQQAHKEDRITFSSVVPWPGELICGEGRFLEGASGKENKEKRAALFVGPEFGTVTRPDLAQAAREAAEAGFDILIALAFNYEAHASEFNKLGRIPVLKARMNADLHMASDLKNTGKGNLFVIFGEPDIEILPAEEPGAGPEQIQVRINGVDVFHPQTGEVRSDGPEGIACWFLDTDYNEESFFVRHAYFLGATVDPYKALKTSLKAEINAEAWATLNRAVSRPFAKPKSGRIAIKVINHLGDEVMKIFRVGADRK